MVLFSFYVEVFVENACVCIRLIGPTYIVVLFIWLFAVFTVMLLGWSSRLSIWIKLILSYLIFILKGVYYGTIYQLHYKVQCHLGLLKLKVTTDRHEASRGLLVFSSLWSSILVVMNKIHWCMAFCAVNCTVHCRSCCSHFTSDRSDSQIVVENRDFCLPHVRSTPSLGVSVGIFVWSGKTKIVWLPEGEKKFVKQCYRLFVSTESTNAMNARTDGQTLHDGIGHAYA